MEFIASEKTNMVLGIYKIGRNIMDDKKKCFIGYHGTTRDKAEGILANNSFSMSNGEEEWLGVGVYFFEDDGKQAVYFCKKVRRYKEFEIIKSKIEAEKIINLVDTETFELFKNYAKKLNNRYKYLSDGKTPRKFIDSIVLNFMYKIEKYDLVRGIFEVSTQDPIDRSRLKQMQIQLCVRNRECIKTVEEVKEYGCS